MKFLISKNQFGFREGKGTVHAIGSLVNSIQQQRRFGLTVGVIFVDLRKAFDSVDPGILIHKMRSLNIDENIVSRISCRGEDLMENFKQIRYRSCRGSLFYLDTVLIEEFYKAQHLVPHF